LTSSGWAFEEPAPLEPILDVVANAYFPWLLRAAGTGQTIVVSKLAELPDEAAQDRELLRRFGTEATVIVPLSAGREVLGGLTFDASSERAWPPSLVARLEAVAHLFAGALARKQAELALRQSEARLSLAAASAGAGLWEVDFDAGRIWATAEAKELYGFARDADVTYTQFLEAVHPEDREATLDRLRLALGQPGSYNTEYRIVLPDGSHRWINARGRPRTAAVGRDPNLMMGVSIDITARKQREENLRQALDEVQRLRDQLQRENVSLRTEVGERHSAEQIIGHSPAIRRVLTQAGQVALTSSTVLLLGETGTGKERFASAIHQMSPRRDRAMVRVNCAAIPATLIESELFGREKGAYTGALARQAGRFELAHGSTIFLDEVGDLPPEVQVKLLRVLQERQVERLGSPRPIAVDVRVIAATNQNLDRAVRDGRFREDLFYRLNVFPITVPPLRERQEDIPLLVLAFVQEFTTTMGKRIESVDRASLDALVRHEWPGNVRELRNVVERAMILATGPTLVIPLPRAAVELAVGPQGPSPAAEAATPADMEIRGVEREHILRVLEATGWRVRGQRGAASVLGLAPTTLEGRMARLGIQRPGKDGTAARPAARGRDAGAA
jgi:formate hydrogenlyase transcriptional activator